LIDRWYLTGAAPSQPLLKEQCRISHLETFMNKTTMQFASENLEEGKNAPAPFYDAMTGEFLIFYS